MKAIIYARFSPRKNPDKSQSVDFQIDKCREYCKKNKYVIMAEFTDKALSGSDIDRPGLWDALEALKKSYILIVYKLDRLARDVYLSEVIKREVSKKGATIEALDGSTNGNSPEDELKRHILQAFASYEAKIIALRTKHAMKRMQKLGKSISSRCPYGWEFDTESPMRVNKEGRETVHELMRRNPQEQRIIKAYVK